MDDVFVGFNMHLAKGSPTFGGPLEIITPIASPWIFRYAFGQIATSQGLRGKLLFRQTRRSQSTATWRPRDHATTRPRDHAATRPGLEIPRASRFPESGLQIKKSVILGKQINGASVTRSDATCVFYQRNPRNDPWLAVRPASAPHVPVRVRAPYVKVFS